MSGFRLASNDPYGEGIRLAWNALLEESEKQTRLLTEIRDLLALRTGQVPPQGSPPMYSILGEAQRRYEERQEDFPSH